METKIIYDELNRPYIVEVETNGSRVFRILSGPHDDFEPISQFVKYSDTAYLNDVRYGSEC
jgi:hypothetical protein